MRTIFICLMLLVTTFAFAETAIVKQVRVSSIENGDTFWAIDAEGRREKYRLMYTDAPNTWEHGGYAAKRELAKNLPIGSKVVITREINNRHSHKGSVVIIVRGNKVVNAEMLESGTVDFSKDKPTCSGKFCTIR